MSGLAFEEFKKTELRTAKILDVQEIPGADRLWKLLIDVGTEKKEIVAGIKQFYSREQLIGRSVIIVNNLTPSMIRGVESRGMLLAASAPVPPPAGQVPGAKEEKRLVLLGLDQDLPPGSVVG